MGQRLSRHGQALFPTGLSPVRPDSQPAMRGTQSSVLDGPAFLSPSLIFYPRAGARDMKEGLSGSRAGERVLNFLLLPLFLLALRSLPIFTTHCGHFVSWPGHRPCRFRTTGPRKDMHALSPSTPVTIFFKLKNQAILSNASSDTEQNI